MARIFLSHSSLNSRETVALYKWLIDHDPSLDGEIFLDLDPKTGIPTGANWREELKRASKRCEAVICLLSTEWEQSEECQREYWIAEQLDKQIFCARLEPSTGEELLAKWQSCDLFGDRDTVSIDVAGGPPVTFAREGLRRLSTGIRRAGISVTTFPWPPKDDPTRAPYRGWEPFEPVDAGVFFGRDGELSRAMDELREMRQSAEQTFFVVLGASGSGKSSFLRAGIVPRIHKDDRNYVDLGILRPERHALTGESGLAQSISVTRNRLGLVIPPLGDIKAACVNSDAAQIRRWLIECRDRAAARLLNVRETDLPPTVVLPLDQAEELFAVDAGPEAIQLLELIREIATGEDGLPLIVAASIRTDSYPAMQTATELDGLLTRQFDLLPMRAVQFKEVITGPARRVTIAGGRLTVDDKLVERLLSDCAAGADMLPLLSLMLESLYRDYGSTHQLTVAAYEALGGLSRVVQTKVDEALSRDPAQREHQLTLLRSAFIPWLATINPASNQAMRRISRYADLPEPSRPLIDAFVTRRLLVRDARGSDVVVEVALEILLRQWEDLAGWLAEERENLKAADDLEHDAAEWRHSGQDPSWLLEGKRLANAEELAATPGFHERLAPTNDYIQASRNKGLEEARDKQQAAEKNARMLRRLLALTAVVALLAVGGLVWAFDSQRKALRSASEATARNLVLEAKAMLADTSAGNDTKAFQFLLAANSLAQGGTPTELVDALVNRFSTVRISTDTDSVIDAAVSGQGRWLAVATVNGLIRVWDTSSATWRDKPLDDARLLRTQQRLASVAISPDGTLVVAGTESGQVLQWNTATQNPSEQAVGRHSGSVTSVAFSPDGTRVASAGADGVIRVWRPGQRPYLSIPAGGTTFSLAFDPTRNRLASASSDDTIRLWNADTGAPEAVIQAKTGGVLSVAFSPNGAVIASGGADGTVRLWDTLSGNEIGPLTSASGRGHTEAVMSVAFNADGSRLVSSGVDLTVQMWDVVRRERIGDPMTGHEGVVWSAVFVEDGHQIVSAGNDHEIRVWNAVVGQPISTPLTPKSGPVSSVAVSGNRIASATADGSVQLWDSETGMLMATLPRDSGVVNSVAFTSAGDQVATGSTSGTIRLWRADDGAPVTALKADAPVYAVAFNREGNRLASATGDGQLTIWDIGSQSPRKFENKDHAVIFGIAFNAGGDRLASGGASGVLRLWDVDNGNQIWEQNIVDALSAAQKQTWASGRPGVITTVAFNPDGRRLASGGAMWSAPNGWPLGVIQRWDASSGKPAGQPIKMGAGSAVMSVAFTPHRADTVGDRLVSGGVDRKVQLWNADSDAGEEISSALLGHSDGVGTVAVSPDGIRIVSGSADGTVRIWPDPPAEPPKDALCAKLTQNMNEKQWRDWAQTNTNIALPQGCPGLPQAPAS